MTSSLSLTQTETMRPDTGRIKELLKSGSRESCKEVLNSVLDGMRFREVHSFMLRLYACMDIYLTAKSFSGEIGISDDQFAERFGTVDDIEPRLRNPEGMISFLCETLTQCIDWRADKAHDGSRDMMRTASGYIDDHYMNYDISLSTVAEAVGLSPSYLSMLFKKETGQNFSCYLTDVRVRRAKELLCCTSKMVYEVAYDVGFRDYRYFSQIFKKNTGMTPRQYQNSVNVLSRREVG